MQSRKSTLALPCRLKTKMKSSSKQMLMLDYAHWWGFGFAEREASAMQSIRGSWVCMGIIITGKCPSQMQNNISNWKTLRGAKLFVSSERPGGGKTIPDIIKTSCWAFPQTHTAWRACVEQQNERVSWSPGERMKLQAERGETFNSDRMQKNAEFDRGGGGSGGNWWGELLEGEGENSVFP
jgi:hypothetical protein